MAPILASTAEISGVSVCQQLPKTLSWVKLSENALEVHPVGVTAPAVEPMMAWIMPMSRLRQRLRRDGPGASAWGLVARGGDD